VVPRDSITKDFDQVNSSNESSNDSNDDERVPLPFKPAGTPV
jgi:hypothetical protein